jgi:hypothetical protein
MHMMMMMWDSPTRYPGIDFAVGESNVSRSNVSLRESLPGRHGGDDGPYSF